ncbi:MAG: hypothetical protein O2913_10515 [Chloroflexi bacterium]|nr:hypothetical protein [Chloroflexota bacterium]
MTIACGGAATPVDPAANTAAQPLVFLPEDEAPHEANIEWWYFNGLLTDDRGQEFSYHFVTFQGASSGTAVPNLLQASLGDHTTGEHLTGEQLLLGVLDPYATGIDVSVNGWEMLGDGNFYSLEFDLNEYFLDLKAIPTRPPVLHQGVGLVSLGPAGDTYYYTRPRLDVTGTITIAGETRSVTGAAWMDHQWGDLEGQRLGWDWASVQLDDGSDLMAVLVWDPSDRTPIAGYGTLVSADGSALFLPQDDVAITSSKTWTSPATGVTYPSGWLLSLPSLGLSLELVPVLVDAEFSGSRYTPAAYWEGEVRATGTSEGRTVNGRGFVELVGYDPKQIQSGPAPSPGSKPRPDPE